MSALAGHAFAALEDSPAWQLVPAAPHWSVVDLISDLHLQAADRATFAAWMDTHVMSTVSST